MAMRLTASEVDIIKDIAGILSIEKDIQYELDTDVGPTFIGANTLWDGTAMPANTPNKGEGVIVGVIDTGANLDHPSFSDTPEDGYDFAAANPLGAGNFVAGSACNATFVCNDKLIGAWDFADDGTNESDGPEDSNGHGSHTASTAVGNAISAPPGGFVTITGAGLAAPSISGVAPHAHLITYDVCIDTCSGAAISGAINQAIADGVDVISYSISGGSNPWNDSDRTYLDAVAAGILVSASAGNTNATITDPVGEVNHRGPWLLSVANSSHNRGLKNQVAITAPIPVPMDLTDLFGVNGSTDNFSGDVAADLLYAGNVEAANAEGCTAYVNNTAFTGKIALIIRGSCSFADKINNAEAAGAIAVIVFNGVSDIPIIMGGTTSTNIPAVMIGLADGDAILDFIASVVATDVQAFMSATTIYTLLDILGNILNTSSLQGPNDTFDVTKPDINGPGTNIFAAFADGTAPAPQFNFLSGTSMSAPHISGSAALMIAAHPTWSPSEIKSAMMMTADNAVKTGLGVTTTPDEVGSGTVDLSKSAISALVMSETFANYLAANPATGGDPATLNIPSVRSNNCAANCSWTRTVTNKSSSSHTWTTDEFKFDNATLLHVTPASFTLAADESQVLTISLDVCLGNTLGELAFNDIVLDSGDVNVPNSRITVAARTSSIGVCTLPPELDLIFDNGFE
ncbi:MAG: S8 family serine peptidase [Alcanivoracaceae bacterium]|nr:S8 family serine peptidase [Alcanivoracaceae bacterium]